MKETTDINIFETFYFFLNDIPNRNIPSIIIIITCLNRMTISVIKTAINMGPV